MELFGVLVGGPIASLLNCHAPPVKYFWLFIIPKFIGFTCAGIWYIMEGQGGKSNEDRKLCYILRGSLDPADYHQPVMTLLFLKRLNDTFEENAERIIN